MAEPLASSTFRTFLDLILIMKMPLSTCTKTSPLSLANAATDDHKNISPVGTPDRVSLSISMILSNAHPATPSELILLDQR
jgi:hypothetical protein